MRGARGDTGAAVAAVSDWACTRLAPHGAAARAATSASLRSRGAVTSADAVLSAGAVSSTGAVSGVVSGSRDGTPSGVDRIGAAAYCSGGSVASTRRAEYVDAGPAEPLERARLSSRAAAEPGGPRPSGNAQSRGSESAP